MKQSILNIIWWKLLSQDQVTCLYRWWTISLQNKIPLIFAIISLILSSAKSIAFPYLFGKFTTVFKNPEFIVANLYPAFGFIIIHSIISFFSRISIDLFSMKFIKTLRTTYYMSLLSKDIEFYDLNKTSDWFSLLTGEIEDLRNTSILEIASFIRQIIEIIGWLCGMLYVSLKLSLLLFCIIPLIFLVSSYTRGSRRQKYHNIHSHKKASHHVALECLDNIRIVKSFSTEDKEITKYTTKLNDMFNTEYSTWLWSSSFDMWNGFIFMGGVFIGIKFGLHWINDEALTIDNLSSFVVYCFMLWGSFFGFSDFTRRITKALIIAEKLFKIIDYIPKIDLHAKGIEKFSWKGEISLQNVHFNYSSKSDAIVLKDFNLEIKPCENIGIVGTSGSGKSTLINLIERLYEVNVTSNNIGEIKFDGLPIQSYQIQEFHNQIGYVSQEPTLFNCTILENIWYGVEGTNNYVEKDWNDAIIKAKAEFIFDKEKFPQGLQTNVGERGIQWSGGQKQRIAIARAWIKKPKILIFDEATSALDAESEFELLSNLREFNGKITMIIIAHRLSTIQNCDKIIVVDKGSIIEQGKHDELIALNGVYKQLMERQIKS